MPPRRVIGIDAGGTKLLGGVVDEGLVVHHRVHRTWRGADRAETLDIFVGVGRGGARGGARRGGGRLRDPGAGRVGDGRVALVDAPAARRRALPRRDERAARAAGGRRQRRQRGAAGRGALRRGARASRTRCWSRSAPASAAGCCWTGGSTAARAAWAAEIGHMVVDLHGPDCQGDCPGRGCLEVMASGSTIGREGRAAAAAAAGVGARAPAGGRARRSPGGIVTELAHAGDEARGVGAGPDRAAARLRAGRAWSTSSTRR